MIFFSIDPEDFTNATTDDIFKLYGMEFLTEEIENRKDVKQIMGICFIPSTKETPNRIYVKIKYKSNIKAYWVYEVQGDNWEYAGTIYGDK